jgi:hypothetical protein
MSYHGYTSTNWIRLLDVQLSRFHSSQLKNTNTPPTHYEENQEPWKKHNPQIQKLKTIFMYDNVPKVTHPNSKVTTTN